MKATKGWRGESRDRVPDELVERIAQRAAELHARLALAGDVIRDARALEHEHHLASHDSRRFAGDALRILRRWQVAASRGSTLRSKSGANGTAQRAASAGTQSTSVREELPVPAAPTAGIRIPPDLREQAESFGRERRWTLSETTRVALERLVGFNGHAEPNAEPNEAQR
jgi:hypothetical protein